MQSDPNLSMLTHLAIHVQFTMFYFVGHYAHLSLAHVNVTFVCKTDSFQYKCNNMEDLILHFENSISGTSKGGCLSLTQG